MKNSIQLFLLCLLLLPVNLLADGPKKDVPVEGEWSDDRRRSLSPARPVVSFQDDVLSIYLADAIDNLTITITDANGAMVYQDCVSAYPGEIIPILLENKTGTYTLTLSHLYYGCLTGYF